MPRPGRWQRRQRALFSLLPAVHRPLLRTSQRHGALLLSLPRQQRHDLAAARAVSWLCGLAVLQALVVIMFGVPWSEHTERRMPAAPALAAA